MAGHCFISPAEKYVQLWCDYCGCHKCFNFEGLVLCLFLQNWFNGDYFALGQHEGI